MSPESGWRAEYGGLKLDQVKRLKLLEQETGRVLASESEATKAA